MRNPHDSHMPSVCLDGRHRYILEVKSEHTSA
jgi:hypothetical protein